MRKALFILFFFVLALRLGAASATATYSGTNGGLAWTVAGTVTFSDYSSTQYTVASSLLFTGNNPGYVEVRGSSVNNYTNASSLLSNNASSSKSFSTSFVQSKGNYGQYYYIWISAGGAPTMQRITLQCTAQSIVVGPPGPFNVAIYATVTVDVMGGNTAYQCDYPSGISMTHTAGTYALKAESPGTWVVQFYAIEGGIYCQSPKVSVTINVPDPLYHYGWLCVNSTGVATIGKPAKEERLQTYRITDSSGTVLKTSPELKLNEKNWLCYESTTPKVVILQCNTEYPYTYNERDGVWERNKIAIDMWSVLDTQALVMGSCTAGAPVNTADTADEDAEPIVTNPVDPDHPQPPPNVGPVAPTDPAGEKTTGTTWNNEATADALDKKTFVEGIGKLEKQMQALNGKLASGAGGGGTDMSGVEGALGTATTLDAVPDPEPPPDTAFLQSSRVTGVLGKLPQPPTITGPTGSSSSFSTTFTIAGRAYPLAFDLAPYASGINILRTMIGASVTLYAFFCYVDIIRGAFANE